MATNHRYSTAREEAILELLTGLADGLRHLGERGIHLGTLCAANIFMCTERSAKISGFGMSDWHRSGQSLDMTRYDDVMTDVMFTDHLLQVAGARDSDEADDRGQE